MTSPKQHDAPLRMSTSTVVCPTCGELCSKGSQRCGFCHRDLSGQEKVAPTQAMEFINPFAANSRGQFSLATLMLFVTLASVLLALCVALPWLGILATVLAVPAVLRALACDQECRNAGYNPTLGRRGEHIVVSFAVMFLVGLIGLITLSFVMFCGLLAVVVAAALDEIRSPHPPPILAVLVSVVTVIAAVGASLAIAARLLLGSWPKQPRR